MTNRAKCGSTDLDPYQNVTDNNTGYDLRESINIKNKLTPYQRTNVYMVLKWLVHMQILIVPCRVCIGIIVWSAMFTHGQIGHIYCFVFTLLKSTGDNFHFRDANCFIHIPYTICRFFFLLHLFMVSICFHIHILDQILQHYVISASSNVFVMNRYCLFFYNQCLGSYNISKVYGHLKHVCWFKLWVGVIFSAKRVIYCTYYYTFMCTYLGTVQISTYSAKVSTVQCTCNLSIFASYTISTQGNLYNTYVPMFENFAFFRRGRSLFSSLF